MEERRCDIALIRINKASRSVFVAEDHRDDGSIADTGCRYAVAFQRTMGSPAPTGPIEAVAAAYGMHLGAPEAGKF